MKNISTAFHELWSGFLNRSSLLPAPVSIPAFREGAVAVRDAQGKPAVPDFPYITYAIVRPDFMDFTIATANVWDKNTANPGMYDLIDDVFAQVAERIPHGGVVLDVGEDGMLWFLRSNPFFGYLSESEEGSTQTDPTISRGIVRYIVKNYVL
ncbi:MAG: hypothetical protein FWD23_17425 [Oscillospiraceae bacterium]|nr:hypothetical protein [Oscillospiraceae bacterium]